MQFFHATSFLHLQSFGQEPKKFLEVIELNNLLMELNLTLQFHPFL